MGEGDGKWEKWRRDRFAKRKLVRLQVPVQPRVERPKGVTGVTPTSPRR